MLLLLIASNPLTIICSIHVEAKHSSVLIIFSMLQVYNASGDMVASGEMLENVTQSEMFATNVLSFILTPSMDCEDSYRLKYKGRLQHLEKGMHYNRMYHLQTRNRATG